MGKKCPKTMSGKHKWGEYFDGYKKVEIIDNRLLPTVVGTPKFMKKCIACGMIDDGEEETIDGEG